MDYYKKYLKYKYKYLKLKNGGFRNCPPEAIRCENHPVVEGEIIDIAYDGWTYREQPLENRCQICITRFANEKICGCCHRICTQCRERLSEWKCPICINNFDGLLQLNDDKTQWIRFEPPLRNDNFFGNLPQRLSIPHLITEAEQERIWQELERRWEEEDRREREQNRM